MATHEVIQQGPPDMPMRTIIERDVNTSGPGPYYVYLPGLSIDDLRRMTLSFDSIRAGEVFAIGNTQHWTRRGLLPEGAARKTREIKNFFGITTDQHESIEIPAQTTLDTLLADRIMIMHGLTRIESFDTNEVEHEQLNRLIEPSKVLERTFPTEFRSILEQRGMLVLRRQWLMEAAETLSTNISAERAMPILSAKPHLRELWLDAIVSKLIPAIDIFEAQANSILAQKEEAIRAGQKQVYDTYDQTLMWLLGRKPERTALSRTLEGVGKNPIGVEEIRTLVREIVGGVAGANVAAAPAGEKVQCPECGEYLNTIAGGPPRRCRFCSYEFRPSAPVPDSIVGPRVAAAAAASMLDAASPVDPSAATIVESNNGEPEIDLDALVEKIQAKHQ